MGNVSSFPVSRRQAITVTLGLAALLLLGARWLDRPAAAPPSAAAPVRVRAGPAVRPRVTVDVTGAVRRPGLYRLPDGSRVADALERAGGPTRKAFLEAVNLAAPLADGQQVLVPRKAAMGGGAAPATTTGPLSAGAATLEQLDTLPGVGPRDRPEDPRLPGRAGPSGRSKSSTPCGIGPATVEELRDLVVP